MVLKTQISPGFSALGKQGTINRSEKAAKTDFETLTHGVLQRSVMGPTLLTICK